MNLDITGPNIFMFSHFCVNYPCNMAAWYKVLCCHCARDKII